MSDRELMQQALDALEYLPEMSGIEEAIQALRDRLAQPEQEPVAWRWLYNGQPDSEKHFSMPGPDAEVISRASACEFPRTVQYLYTSPPPKRDWVGLTDEEQRDALRECPHDTMENLRVRWLYAKDFARTIEAKLREKNGGGEV